MNTFDNIDYLKSGTERQKQAYNALSEHGVMDKLHPFTPVLVGTIPINIDIESSDLDIICYWTNKAEFISTIKELFGNQTEFYIKEDITRNAVIANFFLSGFEIELFGQNIPVKNQNAYRHMLIEHELLMKYGEGFRQKVIELKKQGYKTELAFAMLLGLEGDPYEGLLTVDSKSCTFVLR